MADLKIVLQDAGDTRQLLVDAREILYAWGNPKKGITREQTEQAWSKVDQAIARLESLIIYLNIRVDGGRKGGSKTAERGPEYFKKIAAMRKTKSGGRPKKVNPSDSQSAS